MSDPTRRAFLSTNHNASDLSDPPNVSPVTSPISSSRSRPEYSRLRSDFDGSFEYSPVLRGEDEGETQDRERGGAGLGIENLLSTTNTTAHFPGASVQRKPTAIGGATWSPGFGNYDPKSPEFLSPSFTSPPMSSDPLTGGLPRYGSAGSTPDLWRERESPQDGDYQGYRRGVMSGALGHGLGTERTRASMAPSIRSAYENNDFHPQENCPTKQSFYQSRFTWLSITVLILCLFSTIWSGIFLGIALRAPRYGRTVTTHGKLTPYSALILTAVLGKLIELSFVTSFVVFLGQVLSRRAFMKEQGRGITLAEMSMWRWVVQPGTLITHWHGVRYAGWSFLGLLSLLAATLATLYTPAASALVQPQLHFGDWKSVSLAGTVKASFGNPNYVATLCDTPISKDVDPLYSGTTCLQIEHASQGYHNYQRYMSYWSATSKAGNGSTVLEQRPNGYGLLFDNTSVTPAWIEQVAVEDSSKKFGRIVNNVSLAMPHAGIFQAARDERNGIIQPDELDGLGIYSIHASVPSPVLHVLCANMNRSDLAPIVYEAWPNAITPVNGSWSNLVPDKDKETSNKTAVDEIFGWDSKTANAKPPIFAKYPLEHNTIMNHTSFPWGRDSIYLLGRGVNTEGESYVLCQMKVTMTANCSTRYNATGSGGTMEAICEDETDDLAYIRSVTNATSKAKQLDWPNIGEEWANSVSLNTGIVDANASNSRLLTQFILTKPELNPGLPSPAEALAVMAGCTLLMSSQDTPFVEYYNYSTPILDPAQTQYFNASIRAQEYASGPNSPSSRGLITVLFAVFLINVFVLLYFLFHKGLVTDFSEPPNLFALAVNSPPSKDLAGSCGGGPEGKQYQVNWFVNTEGDHLYMEPGEKPVDLHDAERAAGSTGFSFGVGKRLTKGMSPFLGGLAKRRGVRRPASVTSPGISVSHESVELEPATPAAAMYAKLAKRRSML